MITEKSRESLGIPHESWMTGKGFLQFSGFRRARNKIIINEIETKYELNQNQIYNSINHKQSKQSTMKTTMKMLQWALALVLIAGWFRVSAQNPGGLPLSTTTQEVCLNDTKPYAVRKHTGSTYNWSIVPGSGGTITPVEPDTVINVTWTSVGSFVLRVIETNGAGCKDTSEMTITVKPLPTVTATPSSQQICSGGTTSISLSSNSGTTTFQWTATLTSGTATGFSNSSGSTIAQTLFNTTNTLAVVTYSITPTDNGCPGSPTDVEITVYPQVTMTATPSSQSICSGGTTSIALSSNTGTATFNWTASLTSGTASGFANGTGNSIAQTLLNTTNALATVTYSITPTDNGCPGTPLNVVVTVYPQVTVTATPASQSICSGATTSIALSSNTGSATFNWTAALTSGTASGFANGAGNSIAQTLLNTTNALATVTYSITPTDNGCPGTPIDVVVTVYPQVTMTATPASQSICSGATTSIALSSNTGTATFNWTAALTSGTASGFANGSGNSIAQTLLNTTNALATVTYSITPTDNGCPGTPIDVVVTVYPHVTMTATPASQAICSGANTSIALTSNTGTATFNWTATLTSGTASGFANGSGNSIAQTLLNSTNALATVTYSITPTDNGCPGTPIDVVVTVYPQVTMTATPASQSICSGAATSISLTSNTGTATFNWTATLTSGTASGFANGSGSSIAQTLLNTSNALATVTYSITPTDNGCPGTPIDVVVTVYPQVTMTATPASQAICSGSTTSIALTSNTGTATFNWSATLTSGTASGFANGSGNSIAQTLLNTTNALATVTYSITPTDNGCPGTPIDVVVTVYPQVTMTATPASQAICSGATTSIALTSNTGTATFNWTATLTSGTASGFANGSGNSIAQTLVNNTTTLATVTYSITPTDNGCPGTPIQVVVTVYPQVTVTAVPPSEIICSGNATSIALSSNIPTAIISWTVSLTSGSATGFSSGTGNSIVQTLFNSSSTNNATVTYTVSATENNCPSLPLDVIVTINPKPITSPIFHN